MAEYFTGCGRTPGIEIWDINEFKLEKLAPRDYGVFYNGDSYLVLETYKADPTSEALRHNIHFWMGKESSQDEVGSVAVFATQLDEFLGGGPVQHRQVQEQEDNEFLRLFPRMTYKSGGRHKSGFKHVGPEEKGPTVLYHIKSPTKDCVQVIEVPPKVSSLNSGDSFVLEVPSTDTLYIWHGSSANIREKMKAVDVANHMRENGSMRLTVVDDDDRSSADAAAFFAAIGESDAQAAKIPGQ